jgi:hypothetical protein
MTGKGDNPRPFSVPATTYAANWFTTFAREIDDSSGYDPREKVCPPLDYTKEKALAKQIAADLRATIAKNWPASDPMPTTDPEE